MEAIQVGMEGIKLTMEIVINGNKQKDSDRTRRPAGPQGLYVNRSSSLRNRPEITFPTVTVAGPSKKRGREDENNEEQIPTSSSQKYQEYRQNLSSGISNNVSSRRPRLFAQRRNMMSNLQPRIFAQVAPIQYSRPMTTPAPVSAEKRGRYIFRNFQGPPTLTTSSWNKNSYPGAENSQDIPRQSENSRKARSKRGKSAESMDIG